MSGEGEIKLSVSVPCLGGDGKRNGYSTLCYKSPQYSGGFITVIWPTAWPAPAPGTFGMADGILPKNYFGGEGGITVPVKAPPQEMPDYTTISGKMSIVEVAERSGRAR